MVVLKNQNRRSGIFYLRPLCGFGFFSKSDFSKGGGSHEQREKCNTAMLTSSRKWNTAMLEINHTQPLPSICDAF